MENNIMIAKFEGLEVTTDGISDLYYDENGGLNRIKDYRNDWGALMDVVDKIENIRFTFKGNEDRIPRYSVRVENYLVDIIDNYTSEEILHIEGDDRRDATYKAVVEFIKQYNKKQ